MSENLKKHVDELLGEMLATIRRKEAVLLEALPNCSVDDLVKAMGRTGNTGRRGWELMAVMAVEVPAGCHDLAGGLRSTIRVQLAILDELERRFGSGGEVQ